MNPTDSFQDPIKHWPVIGVHHDAMAAPEVANACHGVAHGDILLCLGKVGEEATRRRLRRRVR